MKLRKFAQVILVSCSILALGACSTKHHGQNGDVTVADAEGAQASGIGEGENFGGAAGTVTAQGSGNKRTYYFDYDSNVIHDGDKAAIVANADKIMGNQKAKVTMEGHTDPRGSREYNVALGERRANAVANMLKSKGVNPGQVRVVSYGAERLAADGHSEQDYQLDRRAVLDIQQN